MTVVGVLSVGSPAADNLGALRRGLAERGYVEGRNLAFEHRSTERYEELPALATSLVSRGVAAIFTVSDLNSLGQLPVLFAPRRRPRPEGLEIRRGSSIAGIGCRAG